MSTLRVDNINARTGTTISVPTGTKMYLPGHIVQVQNVIKTDVFTTTTNGFIDVTGLAVSITPSYSTSKILVIVSLGRVGLGDGGGGPHSVAFRLDRSGNALFLGDPASNRVRSTFNTSTGYNADHSHAYTYTGIDSPATTSSITYKLQMFSQSGAAAYINRGKADADNGEAYPARTSSSITVMEIAQ